jgi:hypothetical protein
MNANNKTKLFFVGFNKTATSSLHNLFQKNGYSCIHWEAREIFLAKQMQMNFDASMPILQGIDEFNVYSDFTFVSNERVVEGNKFYKELHNEYSDSWFILNVRDTDSWLLSRLRHPTFAERYASAMGMNIPELIDYWRKLKTETETEIIKYFEGYSKFGIFDIQSDTYEDLAKLLAPDFVLNDTSFEIWNVTPKG